MFKGFFNRMYNGDPNRPDLNPEDMPKNKFELFFSAVGNHIGDLLKINLIYLATILPLFVWTLINILAMLSIDVVAPTNESALADFISKIVQLAQQYLLWLIPCLVLAGPPTAGLVYVTRNWAQDEHTWLWSDFKEHTLKNWKQAAGLNLLVGVVVYFAFVVLMLYDQLKITSAWVWPMQLVFLVVLAIFLLSIMYAYPMLVTYRLKFSQLLRNSFMLALGRLPFTVLFGILTLLPLALGVGLMLATRYALLITVFYYVLFGFSFAWLIINSLTNATFDSVMRNAAADEDDGEETDDGQDGE